MCTSLSLLLMVPDKPYFIISSFLSFVALGLRLFILFSEAETFLAGALLSFLNLNTLLDFFISFSSFFRSTLDISSILPQKFYFFALITVYHKKTSLQD